MKNIFFAVVLTASTWLYSASDGGAVIGTPPIPTGPTHGSLLEPLTANDLAQIDTADHTSEVAPAVLGAAAAAACATANTPASASSSTAMNGASPASSQSVSAGAASSSASSSSSSSSPEISTKTASAKNGTALSQILAQRSQAPTGKMPPASLSLTRGAAQKRKLPLTNGTKK